jgi:hypothetical protein
VARLSTARVAWSGSFDDGQMQIVDGLVPSGGEVYFAVQATGPLALADVAPGPDDGYSDWLLMKLGR